MNDLVYLAAVILLPLIPAFIIFRLIPDPSRAEAEGPFQGLQLKLGGAFAAYFVVLLVAVGLLKLVIEPQRVRTWQVRGIVSLSDGADAGPVTAALVQIEPPHSNIRDGDGHFSFPLAIKEAHSQEELTSLIVSLKGYQTLSLELDPDGGHLAAIPEPAQQNVKIDKDHGVIDVGHIVLKKAATPPL